MLKYEKGTLINIFIYKLYIRNVIGTLHACFYNDGLVYIQKMSH